MRVQTFASKHPPRSDPVAAQAALLDAVSRHAADYDVIHAHIEWLHLPLLSAVRIL